MRCTHGSHRSRFRESLDARPVLDLPGLRSPLLDDISPPEDGLCDPPAQWTEGTLPSRRHLGRHVSGCPRSLSGMARETPGWIAMGRSKFCHKPFTENPDRLVRFERKTKSSPHSTTPRGRTRRSDGRIFSTPSALPPRSSRVRSWSSAIRNRRRMISASLYRGNRWVPRVNPGAWQ